MLPSTSNTQHLTRCTSVQYHSLSPSKQTRRRSSSLRYTSTDTPGPEIFVKVDWQKWPTALASSFSGLNTTGLGHVGFYPEPCLPVTNYRIWRQREVYRAIMLTFWHADMVPCWHVDMLTCWHGAMLTCWHGATLTVDMLTYWHADMLTCLYADMVPCWHVDMLKCWHGAMLTCWHGAMLTCSSTRKDLNVDCALSVLARVTTLGCAKIR